MVLVCRAWDKTGVARRIGIPGEILREMQLDGVLPPWVMIVGSLRELRVVDPTAAMEAWCVMKAQAAPENRAYRVVHGEIRKSLIASRILTCKYGHQHPPEQVWVDLDNPNRPRPYHCAECAERNKAGRSEDRWKSFDSPATTGRRPCRVCFPPPAGGQSN